MNESALSIDCIPVEVVLETVNSAEVLFLYPGKELFKCVMLPWTVLCASQQPWLHCHINRLVTVTLVLSDAGRSNVLSVQFL